MAQDNINRGAAAELSAGASSKSLIEIAIERGYCTPEQIARVRRQSGANSADLSRRLIDAGILTEQQARACERAMRGAQVIAGFEILEKVGQGGMGAVFRARQLSMDRIVALKILPPKLAQDPTFKTRFLNEARVCAKLSHLNIINGIDCGEGNGYTYFAMEYVDGRTIKQLMKEKGKLAPMEALKIIRQMVDALAYARSQGLVHRDVKPDNIMLTAAGVAKLCDLGLAKHVEGNDDASLTQSGQAVGTPHYISPEQARGETVSFSSDIYSLGATFYHVLSGKTPFDAPTSAAVMALHIASDTRNPCDADPGIPLGFGQVISKMMAKESADRYNEPETLIADMDAIEAGRAPGAARFNAKTSCQMPQVVPGNRNLRGRTTGPQVPVGEERALRGRTTGPQTAINDNYATASRPRIAARKDQSPWMLVSIVGVIVVLAILFVASRSSTPDLAAPGKTNAGLNTTPTDTGKAPPPLALNDPKLPAPPKPGPDKSPVAEIQKPEPPKDVAKDVVKPEPDPKKVVNEPRVDVPIVVAKLPDPPQAPKKFALTNDMIHARFIAEMVRQTQRGDLAKELNSSLKTLADAPAYKPIRKETDADLEIVRAALKYEQDAMRALATAGGEIDLNVEKGSQIAAMLNKTSRVKIVGYDDAHGLSIKIPPIGPELPVKASDIAGDQLVDGSPNKSPVAQLPHRLVRANLDALKRGIDSAGAEKDKFSHLLVLWQEGERDLTAQAEFAKVEKLAVAKDWIKFEPEAIELEKNYSATPTLRENAERLSEWKLACENSLHPKNPFKNLFHAVRNELREDGYLELEYDFTTPNQALDFQSALGAPKVMDNFLYVDNGPDAGDRITFATPIADLRAIDLQIRFNRKGQGMPGFRIGVVREGDPLGAKMGVFLGFDPTSVRLYRMPPQDFIETMGADLPPGDDMTLSAKSNDGRNFNWTFNGKAIGSEPAPDTLRNGRLTMNAFQQYHNVWKHFKIVFRPDLNLIANQLQPGDEFAKAQNLVTGNAVSVRGGMNYGFLVDGNTSASAGLSELKVPDSFFIIFPKPTTLNCIRFLLNDQDSRFYRYKLEVSADDGANWKTVEDMTDDTKEARSWQVVRFDATPVKQIRLTGTFASNGQTFQCKELQAFNLAK